MLDFVGRHRAEFRLDRRFQALLGGTRRELIQQVERGFPFLPAGCHMELDRVAADIILANLRQALPSRRPAKLEALRRLAQSGERVPMRAFLKESGLDLADIYRDDGGWSTLCEDAGLAMRAAGPHEKDLRSACARLLHVDDPERIAAFHIFVEPAGARGAARAARRARGSRRPPASPPRHTSRRATAGARPLHPDRDPRRVRHRRSGEGSCVADGGLQAKEARADLLAFTLDKSSGNFSPTTRYRDYAISRELIHWESQSMTATYLRHESEMPMAVTWRLHHSLPGDLFASFAAAVA